LKSRKKCFLKLLERVKKNHVSLIVVDGMAMLYRLELGDAIKSKNSDSIKKVNSEIAKQMRVLAEIARKQKIPIIITNQVYGGFLSEDDWKKGVEREMNIVGGDLFKYWSKCIIELKNEKELKELGYGKLQRKPLTDKQREVMELLVEHNGLEVGKILGIDNTCVSKHKVSAEKKGYTLEEI